MLFFFLFTFLFSFSLSLLNQTSSSSHVFVLFSVVLPILFLAIRVCFEAKRIFRLHVCRFFKIVWFTLLTVAVLPALVLLLIALWFILRGDLFYVLPCVILFLCFSVLLAVRLPRLWKRELILVLSYVCSLCACLVFLFLLPLGVWEGLWFVIVAQTLDFSLTFFPLLCYIILC